MERKKVLIAMDVDLLEALDMRVLMNRHFKEDVLAFKNGSEFKAYTESNRSKSIEIAVAMYLKKAIEDCERELTPEAREASITPLMRKSLGKFVEKVKAQMEKNQE